MQQKYCTSYPINCAFFCCGGGCSKINSSALQGRWREATEGFHVHVSFRKENKTAIMAAARRTKRPLWPPQGKQNGIMAAAGETEEALRSRGCETPSAPSGLVPLQGGTVLPGGFDCRHTEVCKSRNSVLLNSLNSFFQMVLNPQECGLFPYLAIVRQECRISYKRNAPSSIVKFPSLETVP